MMLRHLGPRRLPGGGVSGCPVAPTRQLLTWEAEEDSGGRGNGAAGRPARRGLPARPARPELFAALAALPAGRAGAPAVHGEPEPGQRGRLSSLGGFWFPCGVFSASAPVHPVRAQVPEDHDGNWHQ